MKKCQFAALAVLAIQVSPAQRARVAWVPNPRQQNSSWVADPSHHLRPATLTEANAIIGALERETGAEIGVAIVDSTAGLELQEFATTLHRVWGVGKQGANNGVLLLWDPVHRGIFISVGYGLEGRIPDSRAGRIRDVIIGHFQSQRFDEGILAGVRALAAAAREETRAEADTGPVGAPLVGARRAETDTGPVGAPLVGALRGDPGAAARAAPTDPDGPSDGGPPIGLIGGLAGAVGAVGGLVGWRRWKRRRPRQCSSGHPMRLLDERADDAQLDQGARSEERVKSVDWDVWVCDTCQEVLRIPYRALFSSYHKCPQCKRRTAIESTQTLVAATTMHGGRERVIGHCSNCGWKTVSERSTARIQQSSSSSGGSSSGGSSGGGGGSFGGGSAGGGGAGGRY